LHSALSPNACAIVSLGETHEVKIRLMQLSIGGFDEQADRGVQPYMPGLTSLTDNATALIRAATTAFVLQYSIACFSHGSHHDDLLAIMQLFLIQHSSLCSQYGLTQSSVERTFLVEVYRVLGVNIDHSIDAQAEQLFRNQMIQRCLSMQLSLSYQGEGKHRSLPAKVAWTFLNLRYTSLMFAWALKKPSSGPGADNEAKNPGEVSRRAVVAIMNTKTDPELLRSVSGLVSWSISLMNYIVDELFTLGNVLKNHGNTPGTDVTFLEAKGRHQIELHPLFLGLG
jgi:hypothetical protein